MVSDSYVYFLYSELQKSEREAMEAKLSRKFIPGVVIVNGSEVEFTDCKVVAEGVISKMKYKDISFVPTWNLV